MIQNLETINPNRVLTSPSANQQLFADNVNEINQSFQFSQFSSSPNFNKKDFLIYFADHISEVIDLALNDTQTDDGKNAFIFLSNGPQLIIEALTNNFTFFLKVTQLFQNPSNQSNKLNACTIQRIATIFNYLILKDVQFSIDSIGFLTQLLPYVGGDAVYELFHTVFTHKAHLKQMRNMLSDINIDTYILNEIKNSPKIFDSSSFSTYSKLLNLLLIVNDGLISKQLKKSFQNDKVLNVLSSMTIETREPLLLNQIWASLALLVNQSLIIKMKNIFTEALKIICQQFEKLHSYHISIFNFLTNIVDINASMFTSTQKKQICQAFKNLSIKFPNSTHLLTSMYSFIRKSLHDREFAQRILDEYISFFIEQGKSDIRNASSANALSFLADLDEMKTSSRIVSNYLSGNRKYILFHKSFFQNYLNELHKPYGGNIQLCSSRK